MVTVKELFDMLSAIPEAEREHIYVYWDSSVGKMHGNFSPIQGAEYDEYATCSGGLIITVV